MKYIVIVTGDLSGADFTEKSTILDFDKNPFEGWSAEENFECNWHNILKAFSEALKEFQEEKGDDYRNWSDMAQTAIFTNMAEKLNNAYGYQIPEGWYWWQFLQDLIPGTVYHPLSTIENITAFPCIDGSETSYFLRDNT